MNKDSINSKLGRWIALGAALFLFVVVLLRGLSASFILQTVDPTEMGVITKGGQVQEVVTPDTYTRFGFLKRYKLQKFSVAIIPLISTDPEVMTKPTDNSEGDETSVGMPVGFEIVGDIQIPTDKIVLKENWPRYGQMYSNPELLESRVDSFTREAMKVCGGEYTFYEITAAKRVEFANCISEHVTGKVESEYSVTVTNVTISNIILSETVLARINAVIDMQQQVDLERQQAELATAQGERREAENTANIQAEMATQIEQAKQDKLLAAENAAKVLSQQEVVEAEIKLIELEKKLAEEERLLAEINAVKNLSGEAYMAKLLQENPNYYYYLIAQMNANALQNIEKMIITEEGETPQLIMGIDPVVTVGE